MAELFDDDSDWLEPSQNKDTPIIYARILVNASPDAPKPAQWLAVLQHLHDYIIGQTATFANAAELDRDVTRNRAISDDIRV